MVQLLAKLSEILSANTMRAVAVSPGREGVIESPGERGDLTHTADVLPLG